MLTPGTVLEEGMLSARRNNWLAAVVVEPATRKTPLRWGLASADVSTGDVRVMERTGSDGLHQQLAQLEASELLWAGDGDSSESARPAWCPERLRLSPMARTPFSAPEAEQTLRTHYKLTSLDGLGLSELPLALRAFGGLLQYVNDTQPLEEDARVPLDVPAIVHSGEALVLDAQTRRNLELTATQRDGQLQGSLLWAIDQTLTAMGGRCLRRWLEAPLMDLSAIQQRQAVVSLLVSGRPCARPCAGCCGPWAISNAWRAGPVRVMPVPAIWWPSPMASSACPNWPPACKAAWSSGRTAHGPAATGARPG